jgi:hypothetical protein
MLAISLSSCTNENQDTNQVVIDFESMQIDDFNDLGEVVDIPTSDVVDFFKSGYSDFQNLEDNLVIRLAVREDVSSFYIIGINDVPKQFATHSDPPGFWDDDDVKSDCKTCVDERCIANFLNIATGNGQRDVDVSFRTIRVLGQRVAVKVCYTTNISLRIGI